METSNKSQQSFCFWGREKWARTSTFFLISLIFILFTQEIHDQTHISVKWCGVGYFLTWWRDPLGWPWAPPLNCREQQVAQVGSSAFEPIQDTILASGRTGRNPGSHDTLFYSPLYDYKRPTGQLRQSNNICYMAFFQPKGRRKQQREFWRLLAQETLFP